MMYCPQEFKGKVPLKGLILRDIPPPWKAFEKKVYEEDQEKKVAVLEQEAHYESNKGRIICALCGNPITSVRDRIEVNGQHDHIFTNPSGFIYHIGCFMNAPGCMGVGEASDQFSWFEGYSWQIQVCRQCLFHMGWRFISGKTHFFGLILKLLAEEESDLKSTVKHS